MASAVLTGVTKLNISGMQKGFKELKKTVQQFRKEVVQPFSEAAGALMSFTKKALIAGAAISAIGTHKVFQIEGMEEQFGMLMKNTAAGKQRVKELIDLAAKTPFDLGPWTEAARTLQAVGGNQLGGNNFLMMLGDTAATMKVDVQQAAIWTAKLYNSLKSGSGVGTSGDDMMRAGIIRPETYAKLKNLGKDVSNFGEAWKLVTADLSRFNGGMERFSRTGSGMLAVFRGLASVGIVQVFQGVADRVKDVVNQLNNTLMTLYQNGAFQKWSVAIGEWTQRIIDWVWRIILAWRNLDENTRTQLTSLLGGFVAFLVAWKTGFLSAMVNGMIGLGTFIAGHFALILGIVAAFATAFLGYNLGKTIYESLSPGGQGMLQKFMASLMGFVDLMKACFVTLWEMAKVTGENIWAAITGKGTNFSGDFDNVIDKFKKEYNRILDQYGQISRDIDKDTEKQDKNNDGSSFADRFLENFQKNFDPKKWWDDFKKFGEGMIPDSLKEFFKQLQTMQGIKFPKMPEVKPLDQQLNTKGVLRDLYMMSRYTLRGIYSMLPRPPRKIVKEDTPRDTKTQTPGKPGAPEKPNTPPAVTSDNENQVGILAEIRDSVRRIQDAAGALPHLPSPGEAVAAAKRGSVDNVLAGRKPGDVQQQDHTGEVVARLDTSNQLLSQIGTGVNRLGGKLTPCWG